MLIGRVHRVLLAIYRRLPVLARRRVVRGMTPSYTVGAICFVERSDGALLLVRLSYRNNWGVPGGLLKRGETPADAARREVGEETGVDVELLGEPAVVVDPEARRVDVIYRGRLRPGASVELSTSSPEIVDARWFPSDELPELQPEASSALVALARSARAPQAVPLPSVVRTIDEDGDYRSSSTAS